MKIVKRGMRFLIALGGMVVLVSAIFFIAKNSYHSKATSTGTVTINVSGYIWNSGTSIRFCPAGDATTTNYIYYNNGTITQVCPAGWTADITNSDLVIDGSSTIVVEWGTLTLNSLTIINGNLNSCTAYVSSDRRTI